MNATPEYQISLNTETPTYEEGFADGYSRAWKECWEYMRELAFEQEAKPNDQI